MTEGGRAQLIAWAFVGAAIMCVAFVWALLIRGRNPLRFLYATGELTEEKYAALAALPGWQVWHVTVSGGVVLNGLIRRPTRADAPWILFYPGNDDAQLATGQQAVSAMLGDEDWGGAVVAYRGFDGSGGVPHIALLQRDGLEIYDALRTAEHLDASRLHIAAFSLGGNIAAYTAAQLAQRRTPAPSLSLMASVSDIVVVRPSVFARIDRGDVVQTVPFLRAIPAPVLVVQGSADDALNGTTQARAIMSVLGSRAEYFELPGVTHSPLLFDATALKRVHAFVEAHRSELR